MTAVEVDAGLAAALRDVVAGDSGGARRPSRRDEARLGSRARRRRPAVLVANLPYNVATPLVADVLDTVPQITRMLVMVQREVAERFAAVPRTRRLRRGHR